MSTNANYKITFMLDSAAMITVHTPRRGLIDVSTYFFLIFFYFQWTCYHTYPFEIFNNEVALEFSCKKTVRILGA